MKHFVVTGCNGYIGSHMCYELKQAYPDCRIHGIDKVKKYYLMHLYDTFDHTDLSLDMIYLGDKKPDAIFHFAAYISVEEGEKDPWKYYHNNVVGSLRIIKQAKQAGVKNFIFSSTAAVYGNVSGIISEDQPMNAVSVYGKTKQMVEEVLSSVTDMNVGRLRYFNACGRNVEAGLYEEHDPETHLIPLLVSNPEATIFGDDWPTADGYAVRDYVHVVDICRAHFRAYEHMSRNNESLLLNIGSGIGYSVKEVVDAVNDRIHKGQMKISIAPRRPGDVACLVANTSKIKQTLGDKRIYTMNEILESMLTK